VAASLRTGDAAQDAYLAAIAEHLARRLRLLRVTAWADKKFRWLDHPWFALPDTWARVAPHCSALRPLAFRERNLFTTENALHRA